MDIEHIRSIAIIGAGTMGIGISQAAAMAGFEVVVYDSYSEALERFEKELIKSLDKGVEKGKLTEDHKEAALAKIGVQQSIEDVQADFVIEAVIEDLDVKADIFTKLHSSNPEAILASNTSSIPITQIASRLSDPSKLVGMHFFNPAHIMKLVEVISHTDTDPEVVSITKGIAEKMGKIPVQVKDSPGFIVNRVARHYYVESLKLIEENVSDIEGVDRLLETSGFRMGPFKLMDLIGVDTNLSVTQTIYDQFYMDPKFRPSRIQQQLVDAGHKGKKTGKGFYSYE